MYASAIIVIDERPVSTAPCDSEQGPRDERKKKSLSCVEILGQSSLDRAVERLQRTGIQIISLVGKANGLPSLRDRDLEIINVDPPTEPWPMAARVLKEHATRGVEATVVMGMGVYAECDLADAFRFHRETHNSITQFQAGTHRLECWIVSAEAVRMRGCDCTLPFDADHPLAQSAPYVVTGYVKRLADPRDLRRLITDSFLGRCAVRPRGREVRPGIWMDEGARPHRSARIVAPAYLGRFAKIEPSAVIARFSNVEHDCNVGAGTVVDSASVLAYTALGRNLDVSHAVVDGNDFIDLRKDLVVRIDDPNLLRDTTPLLRRALKYQDERSTPLAGRNDRLEPSSARYFSRADIRLRELFKGEV